MILAERFLSDLFLEGGDEKLAEAYKKMLELVDEESKIVAFAWCLRHLFGQPEQASKLFVQIFSDTAYLLVSDLDRSYASDY